VDAHPATGPLAGPPSALALQGGGILRCTTPPSDLPWQASALGASARCRPAASLPPDPLEGWQALVTAPPPQVSCASCRSWCCWSCCCTACKLYSAPSWLWPVVISPARQASTLLLHLVRQVLRELVSSSLGFTYFPCTPGAPRYWNQCCI